MTALPGIAVQVSAIIIATLGLAWVLRRHAASLRHAVLLVGLACAAVVPLLDASLPRWAHRQMTVPPVLTAPALAFLALEHAAPGDPASGTERPAAGNGGTPATGGAVAGSDTIRATSGITTGDGVGGAEATMVTPSPRFQWRAAWSLRVIAWRVYLAGMILSLMYLAAGLARLAWIACHATPVDSSTCHRQLGRIARSLGVMRPVRLACSASVHAPVTFGMARPVVLLPPAVESWPEERIRAVLLHELAHVRRNDWVVHLACVALRAVYWFNPLVWMACARLRHEAEKACDDMVVAEGFDAAAYAEQLLALARLVPDRGAGWLPAMSMARPSMLRRRVADILDGRQNRSPAGRPSIAGIAALLLGVTVLVAACDVKRGEPPAVSAMAAGTGRPGPAEEKVQQIPADTAGPDNAASADEATLQTPRLPVIEPERTPESSLATQASPRGSSAPLTPRQVVADSLALVESALGDPSLGVLDELTYPITGLHHVQRHARAILEDDGRDPAAQAARYTEVINALRNTGALASNIGSRPRGRGAAAPQMELLGAALQAKSMELRDALLPVPASSSGMSTVAGRASTATQDLVQAALRNPALTNPRQQNWLVTELETLERVARLAAGETAATGAGEPGKWHLLLGSLNSTARQALQISRREGAPRAARTDAANLALALQELATRVEGELRQQIRPVPLEERIPAILAAASVPDLALGTIRRSGEVTIATYGDGGTEPLTVLIEESASEVDAMRKEELSVLATPDVGVVKEAAGLRLHTWGEGGGAAGYRVLTRIGRVVVNVSAPPAMSRYVTPVMGGIARQLRQPGSGAGDPRT